MYVRMYMYMFWLTQNFHSNSQWLRCFILIYTSHKILNPFSDTLALLFQCSLIKLISFTVSIQRLCSCSHRKRHLGSLRASSLAMSSSNVSINFIFRLLKKIMEWMQFPSSKLFEFNFTISWWNTKKFYDREIPQNFL